MEISSDCIKSLLILLKEILSLLMCFYQTSILYCNSSTASTNDNEYKYLLEFKQKKKKKDILELKLRH